MNAESIATWARELSAIEDRVAEVQTEMRDQAASGRNEVKFLRERAKHLFGLISGREHEQLTLPEPAGERVIDGERINAIPERAKARKRRPAPAPAKKKGGGRK